MGYRDELRKIVKDSVSVKDDVVGDIVSKLQDWFYANNDGTKSATVKRDLGRVQHLVNMYLREVK